MVEASFRAATTVGLVTETVNRTFSKPPVYNTRAEAQCEHIEMNITDTFIAAEALQLVHLELRIAMQLKSERASAPWQCQLLHSPPRCQAQ